MRALIIHELKSLLVNFFSLSAIALLVIFTYVFLWIFPDSNYLNYGFAETDLFFEFMSYLLLLVVPAFTVNMLAKEFNLGTLELLKSLRISWSKIVLSKFVAALIVIFFIFFLTIPHVWVISELGGSIFNIKNAGSLIGLFAVAACYAGVSLMTTSIVKQATLSFLISVIICFMLYWGISSLSEMPVFFGGLDFIIEQFSLSYHSEQISLGILKLSTITYLFLLIGFCLWNTVNRLSSLEA